MAENCASYADNAYKKKYNEEFSEHENEIGGLKNGAPLVVKIIDASAANSVLLDTTLEEICEACFNKRPVVAIYKDPNSALRYIVLPLEVAKKESSTYSVAFAKYLSPTIITTESFILNHMKVTSSGTRTKKDGTIATKEFKVGILSE